jgi:hypothetical protein
VLEWMFFSSSRMYGKPFSKLSTSMRRTGLCNWSFYPGAEFHKNIQNDDVFFSNFFRSVLGIFQRRSRHSSLILRVLGWKPGWRFTVRSTYRSNWGTPWGVGPSAYLCHWNAEMKMWKEMWCEVECAFRSSFRLCREASSRLSVRWNRL